jgi:hypothetical protein
MRGIRVRLAVIAVGVALLAAAASMLVRDRADAPTADEALIELKTQNAAALDETTGPYSRFGWSHPGPILFYAQVPTYLLGGRRPAGLHAGAVLINLLFISAALYAAWLMGPWSAAIGAAAIALTAWRAPSVLASPWNPHLLIFPWLALVACGGAWIMRGGTPLLAAAAVCASWLVQTHVGAGPGVLLFVATLAALRPARLVTRPVAVALAVTMLLWAPVLADVARRGRDSNPAQIAGWFARDTHGHLGPRDVLKAAGGALTAFARPQPVVVPVGWAWRAPGRTADSWAIAAGVLLVALLVVRRARTAAALTAAVFAGGLYTAWSIRGDLVDHLLFWLGGGLPALVTVAASTPANALPRYRKAATAAVALGFLLCTGLALQRLAVQPVRTNPEVSLATRALVDRVGRGLDRAVVDLDDGSGGEAAGVVARLRASGYDIRVPSSLTFMYGRRATVDDAAGLLRIAIRRNETDGARRLRASYGEAQIVAGVLHVWLLPPGTEPAPR